MKKTFMLIMCILLAIMSLPIIIEASDILDATDVDVFGSQAMIPNSIIDQTDKLQSLLNKTSQQRRILFLPKGKYILTKDIIISSYHRLIGDTKGATILYNPTGNSIKFTDNSYDIKNNIGLQNIAFDGIDLNLKLTNHLNIENNIFYNPLTEFIINLNSATNVKITANIFMRDILHMKSGIDFNRAVYIGGYSTPSRFQYMSDVCITDNLFGLKVEELDAIKSTSCSNLLSTIEILQLAIEHHEIAIPNEQNYLSTCINSYKMLKDVLIKHNFFYSAYDNKNLNSLVGDHAIYFRGSQNIKIIGNHLRGFQNGPYGGLKFKSGRNISIMKNYFRNTGIIIYGTPEIGLASTQKEGAISELSNWLVADNIFDWKYWDNKYATGIEYNKHTGNNNVFNGVFINNKFVNYCNIPQNRRRELLISTEGGFKPGSSFVKWNTRDDGFKHGKLLVEHWKDNDYDLMPESWETLISPTIYEEYKNTYIPIRNTLAIPVNTTITKGETIDPYQLVKNINDLDESIPIVNIINPEIFNKIGDQKATVQLTYETGNHVIVNVSIKIISPI